MKKISISVRSLVEFVLRQGDLTVSQLSPSRMEEGVKAHKKLQEKEGRYLKTEISLKTSIFHKEIELNISGRADGLLMEKGLYVIDEIKSTMKPAAEVAENPIHLAQAKFYGYLFAKKENLSRVKVRLTYVSLYDESIFEYDHEYETVELEDFALGTAKAYCEFMFFIEALRQRRDQSIEILKFPFADYRTGQKKLINDVYRAIRDQKRLFVKAPTGTGKTISTLYPAIKSLIYENNDRIFYLTSKGTNKEAVGQTLMLLSDQGLDMRSIFLTAKEKICPYGKCDMESCQYAKGHYDRVHHALIDILENKRIMDREVVMEYSQSHKVCPFEFSLDISLFSDMVVCDYNYAFDPSAYLRRFFNEEQGRYIFLLDEAHNFVDRVREMFSGSIDKKDFLEVRKKIKKEFEGKRYIPVTLQELIQSVGKINAEFLKLRKQDLKDYYVEEIPQKLRSQVNEFKELCDLCFSEDGDMRRYSFYSSLMEVYFSCYQFNMVAEGYDERYKTIVYHRDKDIRVRLFCVDPSKRIKEDLCRCTALIAFSATLTPASYYVDMIGGASESVYLMLPSPFERDKLKVLIDRGVSTRYIHRKGSLALLTERIYGAACIKKGNYIVFFPSYEYLLEGYQSFTAKYPQVHTLLQNRGFSEEEKQDFLFQFREDNPQTMIAFAVLGGTFSEAIDLRGERLSGVMIVSVGYPRVSLEGNIMMEYFSSKGKDGFDYAYRYSAINKVMQAGGRVIRTSEDQGFILLMDDRFLEPKTLALIPKEWAHYQRISDKDELKKQLMEFWGN